MKEVVAFASWFSQGPPPALSLIEHFGDIAMDRFDVRHLMSSPPNNVSASTSRLGKSLDEDRYHDLHLETAKNKRRKVEHEEEKKEEEAKEQLEISNHRTASSESLAAAKSVSYDPSYGFECPFELPKDLVQPETEKQVCFFSRFRSVFFLHRDIFEAFGYHADSLVCNSKWPEFFKRNSETAKRQSLICIFRPRECATSM